MPPLVPVAIVLLLLFPNGLICDKYLQLNELVKKIHNENNSATVIFVELEDDFISFFMRRQTNIPVIIVRHYHSLKSRITIKKYACNVFLVVNVTNNSNETFERQIAALRNRKFVIISAESLTKLQQHLSYFRNKNFTRIFAVVDGVSYAYFQYDQGTDSLRRFPTAGPLPNSLKNLNGYVFRTIISPDIPRVFWIKNKQGKRQIAGYVGRMFVNFLRRHNATFAEAKDIKDVETRFMLAVVEATKNKQIDISMNAYKPVEGLEMSYPFSLIIWSIIAPINGHLDPNEYFLRPFHATVWSAICATLIYLIVMNILKDHLSNRLVGVNNIWRYFSQIFNTMLNVSTEVKFERDYRFHCQVIVLAFVLVNLYTVSLTSFLTVYIQIKQFNMIQDLIEKNLPVMMVDYEWKAIEDPELHPQGFERIVTLVEREVMFRERNSMVNTSFAYAMGYDKAIFYTGYQKRYAGRSLFRVMEDTLGNYYLGFILPENSPFTLILNEFIMEILETGLIQKWLDDVLPQVRENGLLKIGYVKPGRKTPYPLTVRHLRFAWICLASGLLVAMIVFVGEKIVKFLRRVKIN